MRRAALNADANKEGLKKEDGTTKGSTTKWGDAAKEEVKTEENESTAEGSTAKESTYKWVKKEESTAKGSTALPSSVRRPRAQADGNAILCRATSSLPACVFKWPSPGFELCVQSAWVDRTRSDPVWMVQFSYRHEGGNIYLDVLVTDRTQGMPDYNTLCRFIL